MRLYLGLTFVLLVAFTAGCGGGGHASTFTPRLGSTPAPGGSTGPTPAPGPTSSAAIAVANTSLSGVQTQYAALPHTSLQADLTTLATQMVASGKFTKATVTPGGITATLADGAPALIFADHVGDTSNATTSVRALPQAVLRRPSDVSSNGHIIAVLVNHTDTGGAFHPVNQSIIATTISGVLAPGGYTIDNGDVQLDTIAAASSAGFVDYLDLSTHGMVAVNASGTSYYAWLSDSPITSATLVKYGSDWTAGNIQYAMELSGNTLYAPPTFAFTPGFVASHVEFANGAIVVNESCLGQNSAITASVGATLKAANVGRYLGWTQPVLGDLADQTDAFIWDRLLGEVNTNLAQFVTQRSPAQRPFPLDAVQGALSEMRAGPFSPSTPMTYAQSPATSGYPAATLAVSDFGGETVESPIIEYALPSIEYVAISEDPTNPSVTIEGNFPSQPGDAAVVDPSAQTAKAVTPTSWTTTRVVIPIAVSGLGSKGNVVVESATGIPSNPVPITQWTGTLSGTESATFGAMNGSSGSGSGQIGTSFTVDFRADVHPTVQTIDTAPVPQNFAFTAVEGDSTAQVTSITGLFTTDDGKHSASFGETPTAASLPAGPPPFSNDFDLGAVAGAPATSCNNSTPGPPGGPRAGSFCPGIGFEAAGQGTCSDDAGTLCTSAVWNANGIFGNSKAVNDGLLVFTLDPTTYAVTVSSLAANTTATLFEVTGVRVAGSVGGTIGPPVNPPSATNTGASRLRLTR